MVEINCDGCGVIAPLVEPESGNVLLLCKECEKDRKRLTEENSNVVEYSKMD